MAKLPALQFYPGDWKKDLGVQSLSYHDRGVWLEILLLMHESERRGMLLLGGVAMTDEILAGLLRMPLETLRETLLTLVSRGVTERDKRTNALINRRMIRDDNKLADNRARLSKWRKQKKSKEISNTLETLRETQNERLPSSSSSTSVSNTPNQQISDPSIASRFVLEKCGLSKTRAFLEAVGDQAKMAVDAGESLVEWGEGAVRAYLDYQDARNRLEYPCGAEKFFSTGLYRHRENWKYKDGHTPKNGTRKYYEGGAD